jgi:ABC-2 type transport system ATP-binding protein
MLVRMLELRSVRKSFARRGDPSRLVAVDGLSLAVGRGEVFGLLGPNGAGKSTTIAMAMGLVSPEMGEVVYTGLGSPSDAVVRGRLGVAPQSLAVYDDLTGRENLAHFAGLYGLRGRTRAEAVSAALDAVGLSDRGGDLARSYSGGMKRRLNLAAAIVHRPDVVLLDEPTAGVDPQSRDGILGMVKRLSSEGVTVVYTTHYMEEAQRLCDRVGIIDHGRLLALGTVDELVTRHGGETLVRIARTGSEVEETFRTADAVGMIRTAMEKGPPIVGVKIERPDLESVFLTLTGRTLRD